MVRILCMHGFAQSSAVLTLWCKGLRAQLEKEMAGEEVELYIPNASIALTRENSRDLARIPAKLLLAEGPGSSTADQARAMASATVTAPRLYGWNPTYTDWTCQMESFDEVLAYVRPLLESANREGRPFDGLIAFSQGAAYASPLTALLESGASLHPGFRPIAHPAFKFQLLFSGSRPPASAGQDAMIQLYDRPEGIQTPTLNWYWPEDKIIPQQYTHSLHRVLRNACWGRHYEGHRIPRDKRVHIQSARFVNQIVSLCRSSERTAASLLDVQDVIVFDDAAFSFASAADSLARSCDADRTKRNLELYVAKFGATIVDAPMATSRI